MTPASIHFLRISTTMGCSKKPDFSLDIPELKKKAPVNTLNKAMGQICPKYLKLSKKEIIIETMIAETLPRG